MIKKTKLFANQSIRSLNEEDRTAEYIISTDCKDRTGEVVEQSWDLENYKKNPIVLFGHNPDSAENVLGRCLKIDVEESESGTQTVAKVKFADEGTSKTVDTVWSLVKQGILRTVSVGFIPHQYKTLDDDPETTVLAENELLEFSIVPLPANPQAVALAYNDGSISEDDARYLLKSYKAESEYLEKGLYDKIEKNATENTKENKVMSDEDVAKLAEALGQAVAEALQPKFDELIEKLDGKDGEDEKPEDKPEDKPEEKPEQELAEDDMAEDDDDDDDDGCKKEAEKAMLEEIEKMSDEEVEALAKSLNLE